MRSVGDDKQRRIIALRGPHWGSGCHDRRCNADAAAQRCSSDAHGTVIITDLLYLAVDGKRLRVAA